MDKDNPRYADWQSALEIICKYPLGFEDRPGATRAILKKIKAYFKKTPGPMGWQAPANQEIRLWIEEAFENRRSNRNSKIHVEGNNGGDYLTIVE